MDEAAYSVRDTKLLVTGQRDYVLRVSRHHAAAAVTRAGRNAIRIVIGIRVGRAGLPDGSCRARAIFEIRVLGVIVGVTEREGGAVCWQPHQINFATVGFCDSRVIEHKARTLEGNRLQVIRIGFMQGDIQAQRLVRKLRFHAYLIGFCSFRFKHGVGAGWRTVGVDTPCLVASAVGAIKHGEVIQEITDLGCVGNFALVKVFVDIWPGSQLGQANEPGRRRCGIFSKDIGHFLVFVSPAQATGRDNLLSEVVVSLAKSRVAILFLISGIACRTARWQKRLWKVYAQESAGQDIRILAENGVCG